MEGPDLEEWGWSVTQNTSSSLTPSWGVCCTSLKKICGILKRHCLGGGEPAPRTSRNTEYDNLVMPCYRGFPFNTEACANITRRDWNPPLEVVRRWAELCFPEGWSHRGLTRLLCLAPQNFQ